MKYSQLIKNNIAPTNASSIGVYDSSGNTKLGEISLGELLKSRSTKLFSIGVISDMHLAVDNSYDKHSPIKDLERALMFLGNYGVKCIASCGDWIGNEPANNLSSSNTVVNTTFKNSYPNIPVLSCFGNHEATYYAYYNNGYTYRDAVVNGWSTLLNRSINLISSNIEFLTSGSFFNYCYNIGNGYHIVFLSPKSDGANDRKYSSEDITWLNGILSKYSSDKCLVFMHHFFIDRTFFGCEYSRKRCLTAGDRPELETLRKTYKNAVFFSGHSHLAWECLGKTYTNTENLTKTEGAYTAFNTYETDLKDKTSMGNNLTANVWPKSNLNRKEAYCVHIPSCAMTLQLNSSKTAVETISEGSQFAVIDVYSDYIEIKGLSAENILLDSNYNVTNESEVSIKYIPKAIYRLSFIEETGEETEESEEPEETPSLPSGDSENSENLVLTVNKTLVSIGEQPTFTVTYNGSAANKAAIYMYSGGSWVWQQSCADNSNSTTMAMPSAAGTYRLRAAKVYESSIVSNEVTITVGSSSGSSSSGETSSGSSTSGNAYTYCSPDKITIGGSTTIYSKIGSKYGEVLANCECYIITDKESKSHVSYIGTTNSNGLLVFTPTYSGVIYISCEKSNYNPDACTLTVNNSSETGDSSSGGTSSGTNTGESTGGSTEETDTRGDSGIDTGGNTEESTGSGETTTTCTLSTPTVTVSKSIINPGDSYTARISPVTLSGSCTSSTITYKLNGVDVSPNTDTTFTSNCSNAGGTITVLGVAICGSVTSTGSASITVNEAQASAISIGLGTQTNNADGSKTGVATATVTWTNGCSGTVNWGTSSANNALVISTSGNTCTYKLNSSDATITLVASAGGKQASKTDTYGSNGSGTSLTYTVTGSKTNVGTTSTNNGILTIYSNVNIFNSSSSSGTVYIYLRELGEVGTPVSFLGTLAPGESLTNLSGTRAWYYSTSEGGTELSIIWS